MPRALVVGGGIVGLTAALELRKAGMEVTAFERHPEIRGAGATLGLWPAACSTFAHCGAIDAIEQHAGVSTESFFFDPAGNVLAAATFRKVLTGYSLPYLTIMRTKLNRILADQLGEESVRVNAEFVRYEEDEDGIEVHFADGSVERGDLLIGADGVYSAVRRQMHPDVEIEREEDHVNWRALIDPEDIQLGEPTFVLGRNRTRGGWLRAAGGTIYWGIAQFEAPPASGTRKEETLSKLAELDDGGWDFPLRALIEATPEESILRDPVAKVPLLRGWVQGRVVLAGDAAHAMSPHTGAGATFGVEDAFVLGQAFASEPDWAAAAARYEQERLPRYAEIARRKVKVAEASVDPDAYGDAWAEFLAWFHDTSPTLERTR